MDKVNLDRNHALPFTESKTRWRHCEERSYKMSFATVETDGVKRPATHQDDIHLAFTQCVRIQE